MLSPIPETQRSSVSLLLLIEDALISSKEVVISDLVDATIRPIVVFVLSTA